METKYEELNSILTKYKKICQFINNDFLPFFNEGFSNHIGCATVFSKKKGKITIMKNNLFRCSFSVSIAFDEQNIILNKQLKAMGIADAPYESKQIHVSIQNSKETFNFESNDVYEKIFQLFKEQLLQAEI